MYIKKVTLLFIVVVFAVTSSSGLLAAAYNNSNYELFLQQGANKRGVIEILRDNKVMASIIASTLALLVGAGIYYKRSDKGSTDKSDKSSTDKSNIRGNQGELLADTGITEFEEEFKKQLPDDSQRDVLKRLFNKYDVFKGEKRVVKECLASLSNEEEGVLGDFLSCLPGCKDINPKKDFSDRIPQLASFFKVHGGIIENLINKVTVISTHHTDKGKSAISSGGQAETLPATLQKSKTEVDLLVNPKELQAKTTLQQKSTGSDDTAQKLGLSLPETDLAATQKNEDSVVKKAALEKIKKLRDKINANCSTTLSAGDKAGIEKLVDEIAQKLNNPTTVELADKKAEQFLNALHSTSNIQNYLVQLANKYHENVYNVTKGKYDNLNKGDSVAAKASAKGFEGWGEKQPINEVEKGAHSAAFIKAIDELNNAIKTYEEGVLAKVRSDIEDVAKRIGEANWSDGKGNNNAGSAIEATVFAAGQTKDQGIDDLLSLLNTMIASSIRKIEQGLEHAKQRKADFDSTKEVAYILEEEKDVAFDKALADLTDEGYTDYDRLENAALIIESLSEID